MIWLAAGTEEGRQIAKALVQKNREILVSVTTEYGGALLQKELHDPRKNIGEKRWKVINRALDYQEMQEVLEKHPIRKIVDATHPYADVVSKNLMVLAEKNGLSYLRYERPSICDLIQKEAHGEAGRIYRVQNTEAAIEALKKGKGRVLLTTGSKTLGDYLKALDPSRIYARVLPVPKVMEKCKALGLPAGQILGMQGPFTADFNRATLMEYRIETLVTKDSGLSGGVQEKILGALEAGVEIIIIERPDIDYSNVFSDIKMLVDQL